MTTPGDQEASSIDLEAFRLKVASLPTQSAELVVPRRTGSRRTELFVKGPIDWRWLAAAGRLPGKAMHVAVALRLLSGIQGAGTVALSTDRLTELGVLRHSAYRALRQLEQAGLVEVVRYRGRQPRVMIRELQVRSAD